MSTRSLLADFLSRPLGADRSCLILLRVLLARADDEGRLRREELLEGVQRTYQLLFELTPNSTVALVGGEIAPLLAASNLAYFEEHTVQGLVSEGIITLEGASGEPVGSPSSNGTWSAIRLTPPARADLHELRIHGDDHWLLDRLDERIHGTVEERNVPSDRAPESAAREEAAPRRAELVEEVAPPARPALEPSPAAGETKPADDDRVEESRSEPALRPAVVTEPAPPAAPARALNGTTLSARGLVKTYRKRRVVNEVDVHVSEGEIVGLLGPNGAGKTTTFYMIVGLIPPEKGRVYLGKDDLTSIPMYRRARRGIGYLAQEPSIFRKLTVEQNIRAILQMRGIARREQRERLERLLDELGIKHLRSTKAYALSGGERRRLEITRALVGEPKFMLLDEPFAGVDPIAVHDIQQIVADLRRRGIGVLISDHNVEQTLDIVDRAYIMYDGRVRVSGTVSELVWNDEVAEIYLGPTLTARMRQRYTHPQ